MPRRPNFLLGLLALLGLASPQDAWAEVPPEPGAVERTIPTQIPQSTLLPTLSLPTGETQSQDPSGQRFTLGAVNIDGSTVFSQARLSRYFERYLATEVDQSSLAKIAQAITADYRHAGYLLSYAMVPQQDVEAGMVRLSVVEGRVGNVDVRGAGAAQHAIEALAATLVTGGPLKKAELERAIGLIRDLPGVTVTDVALTRSDIELGIFTLRIAVVPHRVRAFTYADNRGTGSVAHSRMYNSFAISSLALQGDELRVDLFAMPGGHSHYLYGRVDVATRLGRSGLRFQLSASRGDQYLRSDEHFHGRSDNLSAQLSYPFVRSRAFTLIGKGSLTDWRSIGWQAGDRRLRDRLRVARVGVEFANERSARFQGELIFSRGLGFDGMTRAGDPLASRPDASGRFNKVAASFQLSVPLGERVTLRASSAAQYSDRPLLSAEEFSLGGSRIGRAYRFNARTGDRGAGGGLELGYRLGASKNSDPGVELFGFADAGVAAEIKSSVTPARTRGVGSVGLGSRISVGRMSIALETGVPLMGGHHAPRLFASVFRSF